MRLFHKTNIDFLKIKWIAISLSILSIVIGTISLVAKGGPKLGIDFTGGAQIVYGFSKAPDENQIRKIVEAANVNVVSVQRFDKSEKNQVLLRVPLEKKEGRDLSKEVTTALTKALFPENANLTAFDLNLNGADTLLSKLIADDPEKLATRPNADPKVEYGREVQALIGARSEKGLFHGVDEAAKTPGVSPATGDWLKTKTVAGPFTLLSAENVGPQVGKDLREKGMWAILFSWLAMLLYIAFRFRSASFGTAAVVALIHDTWTTLGICSILNIEISLTVVAAFLTLVGYSVNDTVVVFDRIRENREKSKRTPLPELVNTSINQTLSRTVLTSVLTFVVVVVLFFLGGEVLRGFSFVMIVGIIVGTYSSIFVAAPLVIVWEEWKQKRAALKAQAKPAPAPVKPGQSGEGEVLTDNPHVLVIFTDLDGTLLEEDGSLSPDAGAALGALRTRGVRVVPLTSKTRLELARWLDELGGERWGAFENGAGLMTPTGIEILPGALPVTRLRGILREVRDETRLAIRSVEEMPDEELAERTGLPMTGIPLVRAREFDLPFCAPEGAEEAIARALERRPGTRLTKGGRFLHLLGRHDKADAVRRLVELLRPSRTIGLGDAPNDVTFLRIVDRPVLVPKKAGVDETLRTALPNADVAPAPAGAGWSAAVRALVAAESVGG